MKKPNLGANLGLVQKSQGGGHRAGGNEDHFGASNSQNLPGRGTGGFMKPSHIGTAQYAGGMNHDEQYSYNIPTEAFYSAANLHQHNNAPSGY